MARLKLQLPDSFIFSTEITVRITDINYGGHLGNDAVLGIIHEARIRTLAQYGFTELSVDGSGIIMTDSMIIYSAECFHGDVLQVNVAVRDFSTVGCDFFYEIISCKNSKEIARAKTGIVFFDYQKRKIQPVPEKFASIFNVTE